MAQFSVRIEDNEIAELDEIVHESLGTRAATTRSGLIRYWIQRGIKEARRTRIKGDDSK